MKFECPKCGHCDEVPDHLPATCFCDRDSPYRQEPIACLLSQRPAEAVTRPSTPPEHRGVGSVLRKMLGCGCGEIPFRQWDQVGVAWCRDHREEIAQRIADTPKARTSYRAAMLFVDDAIAKVDPQPAVLAQHGTPQPQSDPRFQFIIKSLLRWDCLERLVRSIKRWYPAAEILIADDSFEAAPAELPDALQRVAGTPGVTLYLIEHDTGLAAGRLFLVRQATNPYVVLLDDDYVFSAETRVHLLHELLEKKTGIGIAAGLVRHDGRHVKAWDGRIRWDDGKLKVDPLTIHNAGWMRHGDIWYRETDLAWNFYVARRQVLLDCPWDPVFKIGGEHLDHFLALKEAGVRVVQSPNVVCGHVVHRTADYMEKRDRGASYRQPLVEKWGLQPKFQHTARKVPSFAARDVIEQWADDQIDRPNIVLLTVGHTGSSIAMKLLEQFGWNLGDADDEYGESVSVRTCNQRRDWSDAAGVLAALPRPWSIKDPRFCEWLDEWKPALQRYRPTLVWLTRDPEAVAESYRRRGESLALLTRRHGAAQRHWDSWTGPKIRIDYSQLTAAAAMFRPREQAEAC